MEYRSRSNFHILKLTDRSRQIMLYSLIAILLFMLARRYIIILFSILVCSATMLHKRFLNINLGIDFCLIFGILASAKFGFSSGMIVASGSFLLGMILSMQLSRTPMMTIYTAVFYVLVAFIYSFVPLSIIYPYFLFHILLISIPYGIGAYLLGAPIPFLARYILSNAIANLLFFQIFAGLLRIVF